MTCVPRPPDRLPRREAIARRVATTAERGRRGRELGDVAMSLRGSRPSGEPHSAVLRIACGAESMAREECSHEPSAHPFHRHDVRHGECLDRARFGLRKPHRMQRHIHRTRNYGQLHGHQRPSRARATSWSVMVRSAAPSSKANSASRSTERLKTGPSSETPVRRSPPTRRRSRFRIRSRRKG